MSDLEGREFVHLGRQGCGMPWREHTFVGRETICPDQPGWIPPWAGPDEDPEPPIAALFDDPDQLEEP